MARGRGMAGKGGGILRVVPRSLCLPPSVEESRAPTRWSLSAGQAELRENGCFRSLRDLIALWLVCPEERAGQDTLCSLLSCKSSFSPAGCCLPPEVFTMIDSSKKQPQGFPEILTAEDFEPFKEKECLEGSNQKSLKEGQSLDRAGRPHFCSCHLAG